MKIDPAYKIRLLTHSYDQKTVLDIPDFEIPSGEVLGLVGANGSGKTTLLSILALLLTPVSGTLFLRGTEVSLGRQRLLRRNVTLVHQKPVLFSTSVRNNIAYGLRAIGFSSKEIRKRVYEIVREMKLSSLSEKQAHELSGGETQKVVLARALVLETPIILLDEPTNSLDEEFRPILFELLQRINLSRGTTIVIATHDSDFVSSLAHRLVRIREGRIDGSPMMR
jgi:tungstate transport system ATP-binding protein